MALSKSQGITRAVVRLPYFPGDGTEQRVDVIYLADFPRGPGGACAFCAGDPLAEDSPPDSLIAQFWERNPGAETCPMCDGRPT